MAGLVGWLVILGVGMAWEAIGLRSKSDSWPTLSDLVQRYVPKWGIAAGLGWLAWHLLQ